MQATKTTDDRRKELFGLLPTKEGRARLLGLLSRYESVTGQRKVQGNSTIEFVLNREQDLGLVLR